MQNFSYHTHTNGIYDGKNTIDEMIAAAEEKGFESYGISNHLMCHPNAPTYNPMFLHDYDKALLQYQRTIDEIRTIAARHKIQVRVGFEVDYFMDSNWRHAFEKMRPQLEVDYLIGAVHFLQSEDGTHIHGLYDTTRTVEQTKLFLSSYWQALKQAIQSGYFNWIAHMDLLKYFDLAQSSDWEHELEVVELLAHHRLPTELNTNAMRRGLGEFYPADNVLMELNRQGVYLLISDDAHRVQDLGADFERAEELLKSIQYKNRVGMDDFFL